MIEIGSKLILWHIMKIYAHYGVCDFVICCGYKAEYKRLFSKIRINSDFRVETGSGNIKVLIRLLTIECHLS